MPINREYHRWFSSRLGHDMTVLVYGHWGGARYSPSPPAAAMNGNTRIKEW